VLPRGLREPGFAQGFGIGHDVSLRHRDEILGVEELADCDLMGDRPAPGLAELARQHRPFFVGQPHGQYRPLQPTRELKMTTRCTCSASAAGYK
jgi:hypothetical protein